MSEIGKNRFPKKPRLIFMGTPEFAVPTLHALLVNRYDIIAVVTQPDKPRGRGKKLSASPVKKLALENNLEILQPEKVSSDEFCDQLRDKAPDLIIVVAFGQILKRSVLDIPPWGVLNIHASLLPAYRGAAPIQRAILNNESITGLTIMQMEEGLDKGPILMQKKVTILENETAGQLHDRLSLMSGELMIDFFDHVAQNPIKDVPQDHSRATYAHKIEKNMAEIDWSQDAMTISCLIRALDPWPGAYTKINGRDIKLFSSRVRQGSGSRTTPGMVIECSENDLCIETGKGIIMVNEVLYPGKKRLFYSDFKRGFDLPEGTILG